MFTNANTLCKELTKRGIDYDCALQMNKGVESIAIRFMDREFFEDDEGFCYFKVNNPLMSQIIDYIDLEAPDHLTPSEINNALIENKSSDHYNIYWRYDEAHMTDGVHSVLIGSLSENRDLIDRLAMCEQALDNWQD